LENRLRLLYLLQLVDSNLDELQEMKGDLPQIVAELSDTVKNKLAIKKELEDVLKQIARYSRQNRFRYPFLSKQKSRSIRLSNFR